MKGRDVLKWNIRMSAVYALGMWTMMGSYAILRYTRRDEDTVKKEEEVPVDPEDPKQVVHQTDHTKTIMIYKKDFVPYTTRIYNFMKSFSSEPGTGDSDK